MEMRWCSAQPCLHSPAIQKPTFYDQPPPLLRNPILISLISFLITTTGPKFDVSDTSEIPRDGRKGKQLFQSQRSHPQRQLKILKHYIGFQTSGRMKINFVCLFTPLNWEEWGAFAVFPVL